MSRLWDRHDVFAIRVVVRSHERYYKTNLVSQFKPLLTLLELRDVSLHHAAPGRWALKVRSVMAASETGSVARPGALAGSRSTISVLVAVAIVVADMVGVGVFTSLGFQVQDIPSGFSILLLWTIGGIVALCGVFSYGELGAMFPRSSGEYNFLGRAYHPAFGFVAGWVSATVGFAAPVALAAMAFGEYGKSVLPDAPPLALALGVVWLVSLVHAHRRQALHDISIDRDHPEGAADRCFPRQRICHRHAAAGVVCAVCFRLRAYRQRAVRDQPRVRDVFVLGVERRDLHHRRGARCPSATCRARC